MEVKQSDLTNAENLLKLLNKSTASLEGLEIPAGGAAYMWFMGFANRIKEELNKPPIKIVPEDDRSVKLNDPVKVKTKPRKAE